MRQCSRWQVLAQLFGWMHALSVAFFYLFIWWRTTPNKDDKVQPLAKKEDGLPTIGPTVSIIVPARNEEQNIERCVRSLLEQDYEHYEVIAVDDGSTDSTGRILDELAQTHPNGHRLWVLRLRDLPEGWAGKPHAIHRGVQEAQGEWLLFTDADTWHAPNCLRSAITQAIREGADLFTLASEQELPGFWDKTLMPMAYLGISMLYPPRKANDPKSKVAIANGQYILIRRSTYTITGGYARPDLRATLLDDRDLAQIVKQTGFKLRFVDGSGLVRVHMYHSLGETWRGWRKNAYLGNRGGLAFVALQLIGLPMISLMPFLLPLLMLLSGGWRGSRNGRQSLLLAVLELGPLFAYRTWLNRMMGVPWYYTLTHPLAGAIFTGILGQSAWRVLTGKGVDWRGRQYHNRHHHEERVHSEHGVRVSDR
jgi:chlorobactene glucosyltransferase